MLVILNMDWKAYDIHDKVMDHTRRLEDVVKNFNASHYVQYDLASIGAGERVFFKSTPAEQRVPGPILDEIRRHHESARKALNEDKNFQRYKYLAEVLRDVRAQGLRLAAVYNGAADEGDSVLKKAHLRDYFDLQVYAVAEIFGRVSNVSCDLYELIMEHNRVFPKETMIVDVTSEGVSAGATTGARVAAYVPIETETDDKVAKAMESAMLQAGATRIAHNATDIKIISSALPRYAPQDGARPAAALN